MDAYIGEIRAFGFSYAPQGWLACDGTLYSIQQYTPLFAVIGTKFGGNGQNTFAVPDLRGLTTLGAGLGTGLTPRNWGETVGTESVALASQNQLPSHNHPLVVKTIPQPANIAANTSAAPGTNSWLSRPAQVGAAVNYMNAYLADPPNDPMHPLTLGTTGNGAPHENRQPYLPMLYCICVDGEFPAHS